ncbi:hypothetical protein N9476_00785 [bacterium]|nr:hypothetical protein [bacterium]MDB4326640.1 hypothetical protein [Flavobacteriaceae bacterium]
MEEKQRITLLEKAKEFFRNEIVEAHITTACKKAGKLSTKKEGFQLSMSFFLLGLSNRNSVSKNNLNSINNHKA